MKRSDARGFAKAAKAQAAFQWQLLDFLACCFVPFLLFCGCDAVFVKASAVYNLHVWAILPSTPSFMVAHTLFQFLLLLADGTDNHLLLWDLRGEGISGAKMEKACDTAHITLNKNAVVGDVSAMNPGGVRIGELFGQ